MGEQSYYQVSFIGVAGEEDTVPGFPSHAVLGWRGNLMEQLVVGEMARAM